MKFLIYCRAFIQGGSLTTFPSLSKQFFLWKQLNSHIRRRQTIKDSGTARLDPENAIINKSKDIPSAAGQKGISSENVMSDARRANIINSTANHKFSSFMLHNIFLLQIRFVFGAVKTLPKKIGSNNGKAGGEEDIGIDTFLLHNCLFCVNRRCVCATERQSRIMPFN